jgi:uncharacterized membrane protein YedE/YeeE
MKELLIHWIKDPWPWYFSGLMITFVMAVLLFFGKSFGFSGNFRTICSACGAGEKVPFFRFDWKRQRWNLLFMFGSVLGGLITRLFMWNGEDVKISEKTIADLKELGFIEVNGLQPDEIFAMSALSDIRTWLILATGGLLIGFGTRWAGGCTSGHAISGLSDLQLPSLIAVIGFFIGGLIMTHWLYPIIF